MTEKKSILEEALLDIQKIESALKDNTKEILRNIAYEEINSIVKESINDIYEEEDVEDDTVTDVSDEEQDDLQVTDDLSTTVEEPMDSMGMETDTEDEMDVDASDTMDLTNSSDDEVIAAYKKLTSDDEIEIVGDEIRLTVSEPGEYVIKTSSLGADVYNADEDETDETMPDTNSEYDDIDYEIEMGSDEETEEEPSDLESVDDENEEIDDETEDDSDQLDEKIPVGSAEARHEGGAGANIGQPKGAGADNLKESIEAKKKYTEAAKKYNKLLAETKKLQEENNEFRVALKQFRLKLSEAVVFNSNLVYITKLLSEHSTTKTEKSKIIKRFDDVKTIKESKILYKTIANELDQRAPLTESIDSKIIKDVKTSTSAQLNESTAYVDPSTQRILDLINRVEGK